jgi:hypothetical protein
LAVFVAQYFELMDSFAASQQRQIISKTSRCFGCNKDPPTIKVVSRPGASNLLTMQTNSEEYSIRFGGIWQEFHDRIVTAESNLKVVESERDAALAQRDALNIEVMQLQQKYRNNVASLTLAETDHLEARQIFEQVRAEHHDLSRRCLAAEAHTEWLDEQLRQQKALRAIREEEIQALNYRVEQMIGEMGELCMSLASSQETVIYKGKDIATLVEAAKIKSDELLVLTRSAHSKDKQIALLVKERNGLKDELEKAQRSLAVARRNESSVKQRKAAQQLAELATTTNAYTSATEGTANGRRQPTGVNPRASVAMSQSPPVATLVTSVVGTTLRKYKASRAGQQARSAEAALSPILCDASRSVLLDDILDSVLHPANDTDEPSASSSSTAPVQSECEPPASDFRTPELRRCKWAEPADSNAFTGVEGLSGCMLQPVPASCASLLNDSDLCFIDTVLDGSVSMADISIAPNQPTQGDDGAAGKSGTAAPVMTPAKIFSEGTTDRVHTPETQQIMYSAHSADLTGRTTGSKKEDATAATEQSVHMHLAQELSACKQRERDYKSALYLLQEEVRQLRGQVAQHDAMKRSIRVATPKGVGIKKKSTAAAAQQEQDSVAKVGAVPVKNRGCVRKLEFSVHA